MVISNYNRMEVSSSRGLASNQWVGAADTTNPYNTVAYDGEFRSGGDVAKMAAAIVDVKIGIRGLVASQQRTLNNNPTVIPRAR